MNHGKTKLFFRYEHDAVMKPATCDASSVTQRRTCDDGTWSAWAPASAFTHTNCVHKHPGHAMVVGMECEVTLISMHFPQIKHFEMDHNRWSAMLSLKSSMLFSLQTDT